MILAHGNLENVSKMVGSEVTTLKKEKSSMDSLPCDVFGIILRVEREEGECWGEYGVGR